MEEGGIMNKKEKEEKKEKKSSKNKRSTPPTPTDKCSKLSLLGWLALLTNFIALMAAIISLIVSLISLKQSFESKIESNESRKRITQFQAKDYLDDILGNNNWFIYPGGNFTNIGVKRLPRDFWVRSPILRVDTASGRYVQGEWAYGDCGANLQLESAWEGSDIPLWQKDALLKWNDSKNRDTQGITSERIDNMFGPGNWRRNPEYNFSVIVLTLQRDLPIEYPITSVDASDGLKYGVGMAPVKAGQEATIWLAGIIR